MEADSSSRNQLCKSMQSKKFKKNRDSRKPTDEIQPPPKMTPYQNAEESLEDHEEIETLEQPRVSVIRKKTSDSIIKYSDSVCVPYKEIKLDLIPEFGTSKNFNSNEHPINKPIEVDKNIPKRKKLSNCEVNKNIEEQKYEDSNEMKSLFYKENQKLNNLLDTKIVFHQQSNSEIIKNFAKAKDDSEKKLKQTKGRTYN